MWQDVFDKFVYDARLLILFSYSKTVLVICKSNLHVLRHNTGTIASSRTIFVVQNLKISGHDIFQIYLYCVSYIFNNWSSFLGAQFVVRMVGNLFIVLQLTYKCNYFMYSCSLYNNYFTAVKNFTNIAPLLSICQALRVIVFINFYWLHLNSTIFI